MALAASPSPAAELCTRCGLCCDGTLFSRVELDAGDLGDERTVGLTIAMVDGRPHFDQPCGHLQSGSCGIYECRFRRCAEFRCGLLQGLEEGRLSLEQSHGHVEEALRLRAAIAETDPAAATHDDRQRLHRELAEELRRGVPADRPGTARRLLGLAKLDHYLSTWFRSSPDRGPSR